MKGADGTLYQGEDFQLQFRFSSKYPFDSPEVYLFLFENVYLFFRKKKDKVLPNGCMN